MRTWAELATRLAVAPVPRGETGITCADIDENGEATSPHFSFLELMHAALDKMEMGELAGADLWAGVDSDGIGPDVWVHRKTGRRYTLLTDAAKMEWVGTQSKPYCVYASLEDEHIWVRPRDEFFGPGEGGEPRFRLETE